MTTEPMWRYTTHNPAPGMYRDELPNHRFRFKKRRDIVSNRVEFLAGCTCKMWDTRWYQTKMSGKKMWYYKHLREVEKQGVLF